MHNNIAHRAEGTTPSCQSHACLIFDDLDGYRQVASDFIRQGLKANEKCVLSTRRFTPEMLGENFVQAGMDLGDYLQSEQLLVWPASSSRPENDLLQPEAAIRAWQQQIDQTITAGYSALRVVNEWDLPEGMPDLAERLANYENRANQVLFSLSAVRMLCVFDKTRLPPRAIKAAITTHPLLYYNAERFTENIYYIPPDIHASPGCEPAEVDLWLANTKRNNANIRALQESEAKFRLTFTSSPDAVNINRLEDGRYVDINDGFTQLTGFTRQDVIGRTSFDIDIWADPADRRHLISELQQKGFCDNLEAQFRRKDGSLTTALMSARIILFGGVPHIISITRDISDRQQAEAERERLLLAIEQAHELIVITDAAGIIQYVNPAFETITGYSRVEALGQNPRMLKSGKHDKVFYRQLWAAILAGNAWRGQLVNQRKNGSLYTAECSISPIKDRDGKVASFVWISRDISNEIELQQQVAQAQKMEAIGALAGGIAHDFNNLLFPILGMAEMLMEDHPIGSLDHENAEEIFKAARRAGDLVNQILSFSRQSDNQKTPVRIQQVLQEVLKLTRATIPANIEITHRLQSDCGLVMADPTQVHQIAMNLITNAYHAVERNGGTISISLSTTDVSNGQPTDILLDAGRYACLSVADSGQGIDPTIMGKIFEPYFTTKPQGKGTGLGLSVVYGIVKAHGGDIQVTSQPGIGSTFSVYLPLMKKEVLSRPDDVVAPIEGGSEQILIVDDDETVLKLEQRMLERLGYRVEARTSSIEALNAFRAGPDRFDLVITDLTMPNMTGDQLARKIMAIKPDVQVILCTGFSDRLDAGKARAIGIDGFLMKPIVKSQMARLVRKVLDGRS